MSEITPPEMPEPTPESGAQAGLPKWLIYGFAIKLGLVVVIVLAVMYAAGVFS